MKLKMQKWGHLTGHCKGYGTQVTVKACRSVVLRGSCRSLPLALQLISTNYIHIAITTARRKKLWLWFFVKILLTWFLYSQNSPSSTSLHSLPAIFFSVSELLKLLKFDNRLFVNLIRNTYIRIFCMCKENSSWWKNSPSTNAMQQLLILLYFILP